MANFVGVIPPTRGALIVEVSPNVVPTKSANLLRNNNIHMVREEMKGEKKSKYLVLALARFEVQIRDIHFFEAKGTLLRFLQKPRKGREEIKLIKNGEYVSTIFFLKRQRGRTSSSLQYAS